MYKNANTIFNKLKIEKQNNIIKYIMLEFGSVGYEATSIRNIANNADLSVGSLYQYFNNKDGMLKIVIEYIFNLLEEYATAINASPLILEKKLETIYDIIVELEDNYSEVIIFYNKIPSDRKIMVEWIRQFCERKSFFESYWISVNNLKNIGEINSDIDPVVYSFILDTMMLSGELTQTIQYQDIKTNIFLDDAVKSTSILKENIIDSLILLAKGKSIDGNK